jgi:hypothetical protein
MSGWVCNLLVQLLLELDRAVTFGSKFRRTRDHVLLYHLRLPQTGGPGPRIYIPRKKVTQVYFRALGSFFVASYDSQGYSTGILTHFHTDEKQCSDSCYFATDGQSTSLYWCRATRLALIPRFLLLSDICGLHVVTMYKSEVFIRYRFYVTPLFVAKSLSCSSVLITSH